MSVSIISSLIKQDFSLRELRIKDALEPIPTSTGDGLVFHSNSEAVFSLTWISTCTEILQL